MKYISKLLNSLLLYKIFFSISSPDKLGSFSNNIFFWFIKFFKSFNTLNKLLSICFISSNKTGLSKIRFQKTLLNGISINLSS